MAYLLSNTSQVASTAYMIVFLLTLVIGINTVVCLLLILLVSPTGTLLVVYNILSYVCLALPPFCLGNAMVLLSENQLKADVYATFGVDTYVNPFSFDMLGWHWVALGGCGLVLIIINFIYEGRQCCLRWFVF